MSLHDVETAAAAAFAPRLVDQVTQILQEAGHPSPTAWLEDVRLHPDAMRKDVLEDVHRFLINRYWRFELAQLQTNESVDTMNVRYCLVDTGAIPDWLRLFRTDVAPCLVQHDLPRRKH